MFFASRRLAVRPLAITDTAAGRTMTARETLERHFEDHYEALYRFLRACGASDAMAEDFAQEAFLRLHQHLAKDGPAQNVRAWLFRVGYRLWIDRIREGRREAAAHDDTWEIWSQVLRDPAPGAEHDLLARERLEWLRGAVLRLSELQRQALHLRADGLRHREIAEVLGVGYWPVVEALRKALEILGEEAHGK